MVTRAEIQDSHGTLACRGITVNSTSHKYHSAFVTASSNSRMMLRNRLRVASVCYQNFSRLWSFKLLFQNNRIEIYTPNIVPLLLYDSRFGL